MTETIHLISRCLVRKGMVKACRVNEDPPHHVQMSDETFCDSDRGAATVRMYEQNPERKAAKTFFVEEEATQRFREPVI